MANTVKMMNVVVAGRIARMRVVEEDAGRESALGVLGRTLADALRKAGEAELDTRPRRTYRDALVN